MDFNKLAGQASSFMNKGSGGSAQAQQAPISGQNQDLSGGGAGQQSFVGDNSGTGMQPSTDPNSSLTQGGVQGQNVNASGQEDYGDKAFDFVAKKSGHNMDRNTSEKITDGARGMFEKVTGKKVDSKYSN